jgi:hypothetical protein
LTEKANGHNFNLAVNLAQMGQTVDLLSSTLIKLSRSIRALKHGDFATAARQLGTSPRTRSLKTEDLTGRWLELQYGWGPLISDSYEAVKAFHAISQGPRKTLIRTSISKGSERIVNTSGIQTAYGSERLTRYLQYEMYEEMSFGRQLGLTDPASVVWELLPYSFVVDWFVPVGTYLDNLNAIPKLKGRFLTTTVRRKSGFRFTFSPPSGQAARYRKLQPPDVRFKATDIDRVYSTSLSVPLPSFDLSGISHGKRLWNAIALAYQAFGR